MASVSIESRLQMCGLLTLAWASGASAQFLEQRYDIRHDFELTTPLLGQPPAGVRWDYALRSLAVEPPFLDLDTNAGFQIATPPPPMSFFERARAGIFRPAPDFMFAGAEAFARSEISRFEQGRIEGFTNVFGRVRIPSAQGATYAQSDANLQTSLVNMVSWQRGQFIWRPTAVIDNVEGMARLDVGMGDPLMVTIPRDDGEEALQMFRIDFESEVPLEWDDAGLRTDPGVRPRLLIDAAIPASAYFPEIFGELRLFAPEGIVRESIATGIFETFDIPPVGADISGGLILPHFSNVFVFNYDFGDVPSGTGPSFAFGGNGVATIPAPGPGGVLSLSMFALVCHRRRRG